MIRARHTIDATGKTFGRLASQVAVLLRGKNKVDYQPHFDNGDFVKVINISKIVFTGKKFDKKVYYTHSGHVGGLSEKPLKYLMAKNPGKVFKLAVHDMLAKNKMRARLLKRLEIIK